MTKQVPARNHPSKPKRRKSAAPKPRPREPSSDDTFFEIKDIVNQEYRKGKLYYLVDWADNPTTGEKYEKTWEPAQHVTEAAVADWERKKRREQGIDPSSSSSIPSAASSSQPVLHPNWRAKRRRDTSASEEREERAPKRPRASVDSGYTSTQSTNGDDAEASWAIVSSLPENKRDIVLEIERRPGFDPSEYRLISSQSAPSSQALTSDVAASQGDSNQQARGPVSQRTIPDSQEGFDSLRTQSTAQSRASLAVPSSSLRASQPALQAATAQVVAETSRSDLDIPSRQPESQRHDSGPSSGLLEANDEQPSHASAFSSQPPLGLDLPSEDSPWEGGFLTQPEFPLSVPQTESSRTASGSLRHSFPVASDSGPNSQAAQQVSIPVSNPGLLTQVSEVAPLNSEDIVPDTVQRPPQKQAPSQPLNKSSASSPLRKETTNPPQSSHPSTPARGTNPFPPSTPQNQIMDGQGQGNPPSAVDLMRQLTQDVFHGGSKSDNPSAETREEPALVSPSAVLPALGNFAAQLEASAAPAESSAVEAPAAGQQPVTSTFSQHIDLGFNMPPETSSMHADHMDFEQQPATVAPADLTTSAEHIDQVVTSNVEEPAPTSASVEQFPLDASADAEKEYDSHENYFTVTLPMAANTRATYLEIVNENKPTMFEFAEIFASSSYSVPKASLVARIDSIFEMLLNLCDLPAYDDDLPELAKEEKMKHATNSNSKFSFVYEFLNSLWDINARILILSQPGRVFEYLEAVVSATECPYSILGQEGPSGQEPTEGASVILAVAGQDLTKVQGPIDVVIAFDHVSRSVELPQTLGYEDIAPVVLSLVATFSLDHIDQQLAAQDDQDLDALERKNALNLATAMAVDYLRNPERQQYTEPHEAAKTFANFLKNPDMGLDWEPYPLPSSIFEVWISSQDRAEESQAQQDVQAGPVARKRALDNVDEGTPKRPRLLESQLPSRNATPARMSDLLRQTLANNSVEATTPTQVVEVPVQQLEKMSARIAELEAQLATQSAVEAKMREQFISLESQLRSYENTVQTLQPKYMDALRDRGTFEKQCQKAVERFETQRAEIEALKEKNKLLESKLAEATDALANSTIPEAAKLAQTEKQRDEALANVEKLDKKIRSLQNEIDYSRKAYQDASNAHTELAQENRDLKARVTDLEHRASDNLFRIHQLHAQTENQEAARQIDELRATLENRERELDRAREELRILKNGRRETRQASVPRSPRTTGVMSPRPGGRGAIGGAGGAGSRNTSPAPFLSSDGPGGGGAGGVGAGAAAVGGMVFLPTAAGGNGSRWGPHLRD